MKLKFSETGLVEGGIECTFVGGGFEELIGYEDGAIIDLHEWISAHVAGLIGVAKKLPNGREEKSVTGRFWLGAKQQTPFATLRATSTKTQIIYNHPDCREQDGTKQPTEFRSAKVGEIADDIIRKASRVNDLNWQESGG